MENSSWDDKRERISEKRVVTKVFMDSNSRESSTGLSYNISGSMNSSGSENVSGDDTMLDKATDDILNRALRSPKHGKINSGSSSEISIPVSLKSTPADPQVSDVNSVSKIEAIGSDPLDDLIATKARLTPGFDSSKQVVGNTFFDNIISSLSFSKLKEIYGNEDELNGLSYKVKEYATEERNKAFHKLFKLIPQEEKLISEYICDLDRNFPYQGTLFVSQKHICFNSNLLDWLAQIQIPLHDIIDIKKTLNTTVHSDEISVQTTLGMTRFNGFDTVDETFALLQELLQESIEEDKLCLQKANGGSKGSDILNHSVGLDPTPASIQLKSALMVSSSNSSKKSTIKLIQSVEASNTTNDDLIRNAINSIDEDNESRSSSRESSHISRDVKIPNYKLKPDSKFSYNGPLSNSTEVTTNIPAGAPNEYILAEIELPCAPGLLCQLIFNETNPEFLLGFLEGQDSSNFTSIGKFELNDNGIKTRSYSYDKQLHFPVGPKSTLCNVEETVTHYNPKDYIEVINTTKTPNVPSGGSFSTKIRYLIQWDGKSSCKLTVSFWVEWAGSSWIKNIVESSCKSGLIASTVDFIKLIEEFVKSNTVIEYTTINESTDKITEATPEKEPCPAANFNKEPSEDIGYEQITSLLTGPKSSMLTISLLVINLILLLVLIYFVYKLNSNVSSLARLIGFQKNGIDVPTNMLYEMPAKLKVPSKGNNHLKLIENIRSLIKSIAATSTEVPTSTYIEREDVMARLLKLLEVHL